ncbi:DUF1801 domain-containing protein [Rhabdobacter roseus]|uniref:Uncharacterized protein YdhG (YjbR/CyaY superfamily) n=1 Tax=Rhabdobacter roseus TaxID=1655419 RepID=A0A840TWZ9_9BACT|nr:DUF1801 domain-containing protein [Rhabdobacter roseus]MBB5284169.1 uncharacterized protein YdhG (YjbR/CyaY superfamily) [Rhabdobacter roseus]
MQSQAPDVDTYLLEVPAERAEALARLRALCLETLVGYQETMLYGMPTYLRNGLAEVAFNSQKNYISLYILQKEVLDTHREALRGASLGKGCIRYSSPQKIDFEAVRQLLIDSRQAQESGG